jgi:transposase
LYPTAANIFDLTSTQFTPRAPILFSQFCAGGSRGVGRTLTLDQRQVARSCSIAVSTVHEYLQRAEAAHVSWPLPDGWNDTRLEAALYPSPDAKPQPKKSPPDFAAVHEQLRTHRHVTLQLLWEEYREANPGGYRYSRFCELYQRWRKKLDVVMRQEHKAGEKAFIDWAGSTIPIYDRVTGVAWQASLFVAALGASSYTWAEATRDQQMEAWLRAHIHAFDYWGGVPALAVPDNTKTGVSKAHRYDPDINPTYHNFAMHYGFGVLPARPYKPRDKACASYCTLSRFDRGEDWLGRSTTTMPFCNCGIPKRFIERVVAAVANDAAEKTGAGPFMHRRFRNAKRLAHLFARQ